MKEKYYQFSTNVNEKYYQRPQWGFEFIHFSGAMGAKIKKLFEKSQSSLTNLVFIVSKLF